MKNKLSNIKERILYLSENVEVSKQRFFEKIDITYGNFTGEKKKRPVNSDAIENILLKYPQTNPEWLLTGKGPMLKEDSDPKDHLPDVGDMVSLEEYKAQVKAATRLEIQLEQCQERVKALEKTVDQLKSAGSGVGRKELK